MSVIIPRRGNVARRVQALLLGSLATGNDPFTITFRNVNPGLGIAVDLRCAAARVVSSGGAVVFAGFGDSITLLGFESRRRSRLLRGKNSWPGDGRCKRGGDEETSVHKILQEWVWLGLGKTDVALSRDIYRPISSIFSDLSQKQCMCRATIPEPA